MLYKTGVEYGDYTMNHVLGCSHGCLYPCYAYLSKKRFRQINDYQDWCTPKLVSNTLSLLDKELPRLSSKIKKVQLSFTTDPFMLDYPEIQDMSLKAIEKINSFGIPCTILTKGILPKELSNFSKENEYGITLISLDEEFRSLIEPGASSYKERIESLKQLHGLGFKTWVSIEPYPTPNIFNQSLEQLLNTISFVDKIVFGRTNYNKTVSSYKEAKQFYNECAKTVETFCAINGIDCWIKHGTKSSTI